MKNIFNKIDINEIIIRINKLNPGTKALWGQMSVDQMLAHCNVSYELVYDDIHPKPNAFKRFILKQFVKNLVVSETIYKRNGPTASEFKIKESKNFETEKLRLIDHITKTQELGAEHFDGKISHSFGALTADEWNNMFLQAFRSSLIAIWCVKEINYLIV